MCSSMLVQCSCSQLLELLQQGFLFGSTAFTGSDVPTIYQPTINQLPTDHLPTTYRPPTNHLPTDHQPTTYRPPTNHLPTTFFTVQLVQYFPLTPRAHVPVHVLTAQTLSNIHKEILYSPDVLFKYKM